MRARHGRELMMVDQTFVAEQIVALREKKKAQRAGLTLCERRQKSRAIAMGLRDMLPYRQAACLLCYVACGQEVETALIIEMALEEGKRVFCPKVIGSEMRFYEITTFSDLSPGYRGILEPSGEIASFLLEQERGASLLLAPGLVFDGSGNRIGYGGGYYDRFLARFDQKDRPVCIGLCFDCQFVETIPKRPWDIPMDFVLTEYGVKDALCTKL